MRTMMFILAVIGAVDIVCFSAIFKKIREFLNGGVDPNAEYSTQWNYQYTFIGNLMSCEKCTSFWLGCVLGVVFAANIYQGVVCGLAATGTMVCFDVVRGAFNTWLAINTK